VTQDSDAPSLATLPADLKDRLLALAEQMDRRPDDCLVQAVTDYCETWEDYHRTVDALVLDEDERRSLRVVNE